MTDQRPVDLSALDPEDDSTRWNDFVAATMVRVDAALAARSRDPLTLIASWSRTLTLAAALGIAILIPIEVVLEQRETEQEQIESLVRLSTRSALGDEPSASELYRALGRSAVQ